MRWQNHRRSDNIEDRKSDDSSGRLRGSNGGIRIPLRGKSGVVILIVIVIVIVIVVAGYYCVDLSGLITGEPLDSNSQQHTQKSKLAHKMTNSLILPRSCWLQPNMFGSKSLNN